MKAILKREFLSFFRSMTGWLFIGINLVVFGLYFSVYNLYQGIPSISYALNGMTFVFLITVPVLTMRIFAAERRDRVDQLTLTSPVSVGKIVLGKYLALALCYLIVIAIMAISPLVLRMFGTVSLRENYTALFGMLLYGLTLLAIGLFASSLTENLIVAAVVSFLLIFIGYISSSFVSTFSLTGPVAKILGWYDFITPLTDFLSGSFSLRHVVYYVTAILICLVVTTQIILKRRYNVSRKHLTLSAFSLVTIVAVFAVAVLGNFAMTRVPAKAAVYDMTARKYYTLGSKSKKILKGLDKDVTIYCMAKKSALTYDYEITLKKTLEQYEAASKHITVKYIDPDKNPTFASKYTDEDLSTGSLIVVSGSKSKVIPVSDLYETSVDYTSYSQQISGYDIEGQVTGAINYIGSDNLMKVYVLTGHDEPSMEATFTRALQKLNAQTEELNFLTESKVPDDASAVIVFGPQSDFSEDDVKKLESYVDDGGRVFIALDVMKNSSLTNVNKFLNDEGIKAGDGAIAETDENYYYQSPYLLLPEVKDTNATKDVAGTLQVFMPYSLGLTKVKTDGVKFVNLAVTSDKAIAKNSQSADDLQTAVQETDEKIRKESGDEQGRFSLGLIAKKGKGRVAAFGSVYTFTETMNQVVSGRNETLFSDVFSYLLPDSGETSVNIAAKTIDSTTLTISARVIKVYGFFFGIFVPLFLIVCGAIVVVYRKRR